MFDVHRLTGHDVSNMSDNTILMGYTRDIEMTRTFRIIKARGSAHNSRLHKLEIGYDGAVIKPVK